VLGALVDWLQAPQQASLRRAFTVWLKRVLLPGRMSGVDFSNLNELQEVKSMLAERVIEWTETWKEQGLQEGRRQGIQEGIQEGRQEGMQQGIVKGEAAILQRLLERRFGPLTEEQRQRLQAADADTLLAWGDRFLTAASAEDVLQG